MITCRLSTGLKLGSIVKPTSLVEVIENCFSHGGYTLQKCLSSKKAKDISAYGLQWQEPVQYKPYDPKVTGDLKPFQMPDPLEPLAEFQCIKDEIAEQNAGVQKLMSIGFGERREALKLSIEQMKHKVERHNYDNYSLEVQIAEQTAKIRCFYERYSDMCSHKYIEEPKWGSGKSKIKHSIPWHIRVAVRDDIVRLHVERYNCLTKLRKYDYKRFEWLIEQLDLQYVPTLRYNKFDREKAIKTFVHMHCKNVKQCKMDDYKDRLESMKKPFVEKKQQHQEWLEKTRKQIEALNLQAEELQQEV